MSREKFVRRSCVNRNRKSLISHHQQNIVVIRMVHSNTNRQCLVRQVLFHRVRDVLLVDPNHLVVQFLLVVIAVSVVLVVHAALVVPAVLVDLCLVAHAVHVDLCLVALAVLADLTVLYLAVYAGLVDHALHADLAVILLDPEDVIPVVLVAHADLAVHVVLVALGDWLYLLDLVYRTAALVIL